MRSHTHAYTKPTVFFLRTFTHTRKAKTCYFPLTHTHACIRTQTNSQNVSFSSYTHTHTHTHTSIKTYHFLTTAYIKTKCFHFTHSTRILTRTRMHTHTHASMKTSCFLRYTRTYNLPSFYAHTQHTNRYTHTNARISTRILTRSCT